MKVARTLAELLMLTGHRGKHWTDEDRERCRELMEMRRQEKVAARVAARIEGKPIVFPPVEVMR